VISLATRGLLPLLAAVVLAFAAGGPAEAGTPASTANDVCSSVANPCNVTSVFDVADGAVLDFGTRAVNVSGGGQFAFGIGSGTILCGNFSASTTNPTINAGGSVNGGTASGSVTIEARRNCSGLNAQAQAVPCVDLSDCELGTCGVRRCSAKSTRICNGLADCQLGVCGGNKRCTASQDVVRCTTNADCDLGTCPTQLSCSNRAENPVSCASNADCSFGTCSVGSAAISMGGAISGNSNVPAFITLRAADSISISKLVNLNSTFLENDGGDLVLDAAAGDVTITASINATGGGNAQGGTAEINAGNDVTIAASLDFSGADSDGGSIDISAGRDLTIGRSIFASSNAGGGYGGELLFEAARDLTVNGVSALNRTRIETNGSTNALDNFAGDGGTQNYTSGRHMALNANTRIEGNGSSPDGSGSDFFFDVTGNFSLDGVVQANAGLAKGAGGFIEAFVTGSTTIGTSGSFEAIGGEGGGGGLEFAGEGDMAWGGSTNVSGTNGGIGGASFVDSGGTATVSGTFSVAGALGGSLEVDACRLTLTSTGKLQNTASAGDNRLLSRESMKLLSGSAMTSSTGTNVLEYRTAAKPPLRQGTITPNPTLLLNPDLFGCPVCGNLEIDEGETCDDGNTSNGDGCSSECQNENCLAQTVAPGFPTVALCEDGNVCTADVCNTAVGGGTCEHPAKNCSDSIVCTADSCNPGTGACVHTPNNSLCNDGDPCTDDFCAVGTGCGGTANTDPCDDDNTCTENDICSNKTCSGTFIEGCGFCGDGQVNPPEQCDDGNATFVAGEYCGVACVRIPCGKPTNSTGVNPKSSDALFTLKAAVGQASCQLRVCDVDNSTKVLSSDALRILRKAVGQSVTLNCPV
jgi:cysteine-rich repeat protein